MKGFKLFPTGMMYVKMFIVYTHYCFICTCFVWLVQLGWTEIKTIQLVFLFKMLWELCPLAQWSLAFKLCVTGRQSQMEVKPMLFCMHSFETLRVVAISIQSLPMAAWWLCGVLECFPIVCVVYIIKVIYCVFVLGLTLFLQCELKFTFCCSVQLH
jgi:hypothetical protein